ncbi:MAG: hypothetical protein KJZ96_14210 [Rhodocyclaceae bacterium]|nr:hypothetical protein [Rhodocyclaceae bacterium]
MNLLNTLTRAADEEQLRLRPLPEHAAATQAEHLRQHYALLLAAALTAQAAVSDPQTRLLRLMLDALKLGDIRAPLFEQARELTPEPLLEAARLIREAGFAHHLVLDVLVLLRLDAPLGDEAAHLIAELAAFLGLDETELATRARDAVDILGLSPKIKDADHADASKDGEDDGSEDAAEARPPLLAELWPGRLSQPLTTDALRRGLQGGLWVLDADLDVDFPWQADDAILVFRNGAILNTFAKEGEVKLTDCRLVDVALNFQGACSIALVRCDWRGNYDPEAKRTALKSVGQALTVTDCQFSTRNARAIAVQGNDLTLTGSRFTYCGCRSLNGGAVWHSDHARAINDCYFDRCLAALGGAVFVNMLYGIERCEFFACESRALQDKNAGDVAVYAYAAKAKTAVFGCVFRRTSLAIGDTYDGSDATFVRSTQFQHANLFYHNKYSGNKITFDCIFTYGREIEIRFNQCIASMREL